MGQDNIGLTGVNQTQSYWLQFDLVAYIAYMTYIAQNGSYNAL